MSLKILTVQFSIYALLETFFSSLQRSHLQNGNNYTFLQVIIGIMIALAIIAEFFTSNSPSTILLSIPYLNTVRLSIFRNINS